MHAIGFMQGRLSPRINGRIQAFPAAYWEAEFPQAERLGLSLVEWTLDQEGLHANPLLTENGREQIGRLSRKHGIRVQSVTGDCFMQAPFHKAQGADHERLLDDLRAIIRACGAAGVRFLVFPLVDAGRIENAPQAEALHEGLAAVEPLLRELRVMMLFESDFAPRALAAFIAGYPGDVFGINYDIGNSASLGHDPREEIRACGARITNVHVKDRIRGGTTVPLGEGDADFDTVFAELARARYAGDFILQTARATDEAHAAALAKYRDMVRDWIRREFAS
ncbi:MAG TPA: sugar phosphate isomerase/epimerase [Burkholderiales bacterium]|nr:sugar phosphate isomerase/epimerase [Burkholderiales bacterium]